MAIPVSPYRADSILAAGDEDIVEDIYDLVQTLNDDRVSDQFYFLLTEAFERFAPNVEMELVRRKNVDGIAGLQQAIERMGERHAARLAARAEMQTQREDDDA